MDDGLSLGEELTSWREQYSFLKVFYANVFFACLSFGLFTPWIHEYLDQINASSSFAFPILMANNVGEIVGALVFGVLYNNLSTKTTLLSSIIAGLAGCAFYLLSITVMGETRVPVPWLVTARFLQGMWTGGQQTAELAYVSDVVADADKLKVLSELGIASVAGFLFGPGLGMGMHLLDLHFGAAFAYFPTLIHIVCIAGVLYMTSRYFVELPMDCRLAGSPGYRVMAPNRVGVALSCVLCFVIMTSFAVCEHVTKPLLTHDYEVIMTAVQNEREDTYEILAIALVVSVGAYLVVHWADGKISDRKLLQCSQIVVAVGWFFTFDFTVSILTSHSFVLGVAIGSFAIPICRIALLSIYSKILGPNRAVSTTQGPYMGVLIAVGASAKAVEPLWSRATFPISKLLCFGIICALEILSVIFAALLWRNLRPHIENERMSFITLADPDLGTLLPMTSYEELPTPSDHSDDSYMRDNLVPQKNSSNSLNSRLLEMPRRCFSPN